MDFQGNRVLITGGPRGIGQAVAIAFADAGAQVAITYKNSKELAERALAGLNEGLHAAFQSDVSNPAEAERAEYATGTVIDANGASHLRS